VKDWKVRLPLYGATLATGGAFSVLFVGGALPYLLGAALVALLVGSAGAYRFALLFPAVALYVLVTLYGMPPLTVRGWRQLLDRIGQDIYEAVGIMYANPIPYDAHPGLFVLLVPILMIVVVFATSATLYEYSPVVSVAVLGMTIGVLGTISLEVGVGLFFALFLVSGVALLLLSGDGARRGEGLKPAAVLAGALVLLLVLALPSAPLAKEALRPAAVDWTKIGTSDASRLALEVDVGDYLTTGRDAQLMRIESPEPLLWRGGTLDYFDGARWSSTVEPVEDYGEEISAGVPTYEVQQRVEMLEAETNLIFGGYRISGVTVQDAQERTDGSWASVRPFTEGSYYRVLSRIPQPTTAQLQAAGAVYPASIQEKFLQLPAQRPEVLHQTAQEILASYEPQTPYAAARAIERYLIYDGGFTYDLSVDYGRADQATEEFLGEGKRGFCTQFATSMALLAREMGIPSRVVYGATAGNEAKPGEYVVTGYDMHTWVEIYFPGVGWYPFDPTPGFSVPAIMEANAPRPPLPIPEYNASAQNPAPREQEPPVSAPETQKAPTNEGSQGPAEKDPAPTSYTYYVVPPVLLLALLIAFVPLLKRLLVARGRPDDLYQDLVGRLRDVLPPGMAGAMAADSPALTPTERLSLLVAAAGVEAQPFREFARTYSESLYAPDPRPDAARAYRKALREYEKLPRWKRALGALNPGSLLSRARQALVAYRARLGKALRGRKG
jgi:transglutaminase-like putative cysteine protease